MAKVSHRMRRPLLRVVVAVVAMVASVLTVVTTASAEDDVVFECSVEATDGGVVLSWQETPEATEYQYRLDMPGSGSAYVRVTGDSVFIPLRNGANATIAMSPIFADGSTQPRTDCGEGAPNEGTGEIDLTCSVTSAAGGIQVTWNEINGAVEYATKLRVDGQSAVYRRVKDTSAFISLPNGVSGSVSVTPVFADGSIRPRSECGSAAPNEGTGASDFTCEVSPTPSGILLEWSATTGAVEYQYKLSIEGQGSRYTRLTGTSALIELPAGTEATVGLAPIFSDGSTMSRTACGTATAGEDPDDPSPVPTIDSCSLSDAGDNVARFTWTARNTGEVNSLTWKIAYTFTEPGDPGGISGEVARSFDPTDRSYDIDFQPGITVAGTITIEDVDGEVTELIDVDCGSVTLADDPDPGEPEIATCTVSDAGAEGFRIDWTGENLEGLDISWRYSYSFIENAQDTTADFGVDNNDDLRSIVIPAPNGVFVTDAVVSIESINGQPGGPVRGCGTTIVGGTASGPPCLPGDPGEVSFGTSLIPGTVSYEIVVENAAGQIEIVPVLAAFDPIVVPGTPGETVIVRVRTVFNNGTRSLESDCGDVVISDVGGPGDPQPIIDTCTVSDAGFNVALFEWTARNTEGTEDFTWRVDYEFTDPDDPNNVLSRSEFTDGPSIRFADLRFAPGTTVSGSVQIFLVDGQFGEDIFVDCGTITLADDPAPGEPELTSCAVSDAGAEGFRIDWAGENLEGLDITWRYNYEIVENAQEFSRNTAVNPDSDVRSVVIPVPLGTAVLTSSIAIESINGNVGGPTLDCGSTITGGLAAGPSCSANEAGEINLGFSSIPGVASYDLLVERGDGELEVIPVLDNNAAPIPIPGTPGDVLPVRARTVFEDGTFSLETDCGQVTIVDLDAERPSIVSCRAFDAGALGVGIEWVVDKPENVGLFTYEYRWVLPGETSGQGETGTNPPDRISNDGTTWTVTIGFEPGTIMTQTSVRITSNFGSSELECGVEGAVAGGIVGGPECFVVPNQVVITSPIYDFTGFEIEAVQPDGTLLTERVDNGGRQFPPGAAGATVDVSVRSVLPDGSLSLAEECGEVVIPDGPTDDVQIRSCDTEGLFRLIRFEWDAIRPANVDSVTWVIDYTATLPDGSVISDSIREFNDDSRRTFLRELPFGTVVSAQMTAEVEGAPDLSEPVDCGTGTVGGDGPSPACTIDGLVVSFIEDPSLFDFYWVTLSQDGGLSDAAEGFSGSPHAITNFQSLVGTYDVNLHGSYLDDSGDSAASFCGTVTFDG